MNIKIKAALTVLAGLGLLTLISVGILSVPEAWWALYGITIIESAVMVVGIYLMYRAAVDYYTWKEEQKQNN